jgi:hypothetical protein
MRALQPRRPSTGLRRRASGGRLLAGIASFSGSGRTAPWALASINGSCTGRRSRRIRALRGAPKGQKWKADSYVRSEKENLVRCIREKGIELSAEGKAALDALADTFDAWEADPTAPGKPLGGPSEADLGSGGTPVAPGAEMPLGDAENHFPARCLWATRKTIFPIGRRGSPRVGLGRR